MFMTIAEITKRYNVSRSALLDWERKSYLRCSKTPGGHRRYEEEDVKRIMGAEANEPTYLIYFDSYRSLPQTIKLVSSYEVGNTEATIIGEMNVQDMAKKGFSKIETGVYHKQPFFSADGYKEPAIPIFLKDLKSDDEVKIDEPFADCRYKEEKDVLILYTFDLYPRAIKNRYNVSRYDPVPPFLFGRERKDRKVILVSYDKVDQY